MLDDFREWLSDNLRYILLGLAILLIFVIAFCVVRLVTGGSSGSSNSSSSSVESGQVTEKMTEQAIQTEDKEQDSNAAQTETAAQATSSLTKDDAAILTLVKKYYEAAAAKDIAALETICDPWNDEVKDSILQNNVIESYDNISTYSKAGPIDHSYVVYTYYLGKIANIDTEVPSLTMLYLTTSEEGELVVSDRKASQEVSDYIAAVSSDQDVQALIADVNAQCEKAKNSDPVLKEFMDSLDSSDGQESSTTDGNDTVVSGSEMVCTAAELNIRQEPNTYSAIMGVLTMGATVTKVQDAEDGWCQIRYETGGYTIEGYVKSEYLSPAGSSNAGDTQA